MESGGEGDVDHRLLRERNWLRAVVETSPLGILLVEAEEPERIQANRKARDLFGPEFDINKGLHVKARAIRDAQGQRIPVENLAALRALRGESFAMEEQIVRKPRAAVPVMVSASPVHDAAGTLLGAVVIIQDITHLKELERLREEWAAVVAHDLRQPLSVISIALQSLQRLLEPDPKIEKVISRAKTSAERLGRMIGDLLDFSRIEANRLELEPVVLESEQFLRLFLERLAGELLPNPIRLEVRGTTPTIEADPTRLEQALGNVISNAARYGTPDTEIVVSLESRGGELLLSIMNYGQGLSPTQLDRLFQRFRRFHKDPSKGIGLGLYISQGIIEAHGGRMWAESVPGKTTTFHMALPAGSSAGD